MTLELHATPEEVMRAVEALQEFAPTQGVPEKVIFVLALALEECGSNIVNHALRRDARHTFHVVLEYQEDSFIMELRDRGPAFDPTAETERPAPPDGAEQAGGWGLLLVRRYMDGIQYVREAGENVLRLTKRLGKAAGQESIC